MKNTFYNTKVTANEFDRETLQTISQIHQSLRNLFLHLNNEKGYEIPEYLINSYENWHEETEVRLGMKPSGKFGKKVIGSVMSREAKYAPLTVPAYITNMTYYAREIGRNINPRFRKTQEQNQEL